MQELMTFPSINIKVDDELKDKWHNFVGVAVMADIRNSEFCQELWNEIEREITILRETHDIESIKKISGILATRQAYKACGKDPSRYRPSNEQLMRRVIQNKDLYKVNTVVDLLNLASLKYGYSIGGFDRELVSGDSVSLGVGHKGEPYVGIGRGTLNIEGMPVYRDAKGCFATPTSDHERTKIVLQTNKLLVFVNGYDGNEKHVKDCSDYIVSLLRKYAETTQFEMNSYR